MTDLQRTVVVGTSCCGKTTFAQRLAAALGQPHIELDALHWLPDWIERPEEQFRTLVATAIAQDQWIVDGNYGMVRDLVWNRATGVVWLNYDFATVLMRALRRTFRRSLSGEELYSGNKETLRRAFLHRDSILLWVLTTFKTRRKAYAELRQAKAFPHLRWFEFRAPAEANRFLSSLEPKGRRQGAECFTISAEE